MTIMRRPITSQPPCLSPLCFRCPCSDLIMVTTTNGEQKNIRRKVGLKGGESTQHPGEILLVPIVSTVSYHFILDGGWWYIRVSCPRSSVAIYVLKVVSYDSEVFS